MRLRFRYSLLTLLLLTAAVAVGVKLWRGPHHVVDRSNPQMEEEYTYYRDWAGTKIMDGVRVRRYLISKTSPSSWPSFAKNSQDPRMKQFAAHPATATIMLDYYRRGEKLTLGQTLVSIPKEFADQNLKEPAMSYMDAAPFQVPERAEFDSAIEHEKRKCLELGGYVWEMYGLPPREN